MMIQFLFILIGVLLVAVLGLVLILKMQKKSIDTMRQDLAAYQTAVDTARRDISRLNASAQTQVKIEEKANEERKELSNTTNSDLVERANNLF
jgi:predicted Holliday junction resolvase-like endonuclease